MLARSGFFVVVALLVFLYLTFGLPQQTPQASTLTPLDEALKSANTKVKIDGINSWGGHQVTQRMESVTDDYWLEPEDVDEWTALLNKKDADIYARLSAATILYEESAEARQLIDVWLTHEDFRYRYNAAMALKHAMQGPDSRAYHRTVEVLESSVLEEPLPADQQIDESKKDRFDANNLKSPLGELCCKVAGSGDKSLEPMLLEIFDRQIHSATRDTLDLIATALYQLGSEKAGSCYVYLLDTCNDTDWMHEGDYAQAIVRLGYLEGVPAIIDRLHHRRKGVPAGACIDLLVALRDLRDPELIPEIEKFIDGHWDKRSIKAAENVIEYLQDEDHLNTILNKLEEPDRSAYSKSYLMGELCAFDDMSVLPTLEHFARNSTSSLLRMGAILEISTMRTPESRRLLVDLMEVDYTTTIDDSGRNPPEFYASFTPKFIARMLRWETTWNYGVHPEKWRAVLSVDR
ncbi:MAG: HEAT repeat domain-containing protein [Pirellulaceae bacterium]